MPFGADSYVVSDCSAISDIVAGHHFAPDMAHAAAPAIKAGHDSGRINGGYCGRLRSGWRPALLQSLVS
jgi:beta-glucosidase-like glycosyl hydrolase